MKPRSMLRTQPDTTCGRNCQARASAKVSARLNTANLAMRPWNAAAVPELFAIRRFVALSLVKEPEPSVAVPNVAAAIVAVSEPEKTCTKLPAEAAESHVTTKHCHAFVDNGVLFVIYESPDVRPTSNSTLPVVPFSRNAFWLVEFFAARKRLLVLVVQYSQKHHENAFSELIEVAAVTVILSLLAPPNVRAIKRPRIQNKCRTPPDQRR